MRVQQRYYIDIDDVWAAIAGPGCLAGWYAQVDGDLRSSGAIHIYVSAEVASG